jgi:hypothetical protein
MRAALTLGKLPLVAALFAITLVTTGCTFDPPISGFRPVYPPLTASVSMSLSKAQRGDVLNWPMVDSLQPTLRWQPFPGEHDYPVATFRIGPVGEVKPFVPVDTAIVRDITYDLRIWDVLDEKPVGLAYEVERLPDPSHKLTRPLKPDTEYYWSVRARFVLNGQQRVSDWSLSQLPCEGLFKTDVCGREKALATGQIPLVSYYRFKTPKQ